MGCEHYTEANVPYAPAMFMLFKASNLMLNQEWDLLARRVAIYRDLLSFEWNLWRLFVST